MKSFRPTLDGFARAAARAAVVSAATVALLAGLSPLGAQDYTAATEGTRILQNPGSEFSIKVLVEGSNLGSSEVEIGEITFPAGSDARQGHRHGSIEIFYVLSGELVHVVNGTAHRLTPGMVGIVKPGDEVIHRVPGTDPVKALVIWAPGGELAGIARGMEERPIGGEGGSGGAGAGGAGPAPCALDAAGRLDVPPIPRDFLREMWKRRQEHSE